jgi:predicted amidohydrolase YtcJ
MSHETNTLEAEILIHNANVVTMDIANPMATAVAIRGDRFLAVGNGSDVMQYKRVFD